MVEDCDFCLLQREYPMKTKSCPKMCHNPPFSLKEFYVFPAKNLKEF
jgi:hypothetical protein